MKSNKKNYFNSMWPAIILAVLVLAALFLYTSRKMGVSQVSPSPTTNPSSVVEEQVDGVYINHTYGFKFNYLSNIFDKVNPWFDVSKGFYSSTGRFPQLSVAVYTKEYFGDFYNNCRTAAAGATIGISEKTGSRAKKLYSRGNICVSETTPYGEGEVEPGWQYGLTVPSVVNPDEIITLSLSTGNLKELQNFRGKFDELVKSFEFLDK